MVHKVTRLTLMGILWLWANALAAQCPSLDIKADITNGCAPVSVKFTLLGNPGGEQISWNFGSGWSSWSIADTVKYNLYSVAGTYSVYARTKDNWGNICYATKSNYIYVASGNNLKYYIDKPLLCDLKDSVSFIDSTPGIASREWIVDGVAYTAAPKVLKVKLNTPGIKSASLKVLTNTGCISSIKVDTAVIAYTAPYVNFAAVPDTGCPDFNSTLNYAVGGMQSQGMYVTEQTWNMPGAAFPVSTTSVANPVYKNPGQFDVTLTLKTNKGCTYVKKKDDIITVFKLPDIRIENDSLEYYCKEAHRTFYNTTKKDATTLGRFEWEFASGGSQEDPKDTAEIARDSIKCVFQGGGMFGMRLKYFYKNCYADTFYPNLVGLRETAAEVGTSGTDFCFTPALVNFYDSACRVTAPGTYTSFWKISGPAYLDTNRLDTATRIFTQKGKYTVQLSIKSSWGCTDTKDLELNVGEADLQINKINTFGCPYENLKITAKLASFDPKHNRTQVLWRFYKADDTTVFLTDTNQNPVYYFADTGWHNISCVAWNDKGCRDSVYDTSVVRVAPIKADFIRLDSGFACPGHNFVLKQNTDPNVPGNLHQWSFANHSNLGISQTGWNNTVTMPLYQPGAYQVKLMALRTKCSDTAVKDSFLFVNGINAKAWVDTAISCAPLTLMAHSSILLNYHKGSPDSSVFYVWELYPTSGAVIDSPNSPHTKITLNTPGCYQLNLSVYNSTGCNQLLEKVATLCLGNAAKYDISSIWPCVNDTQKTVNKSIGSVAYKWRAEGGTVDFVPNDTAAAPWVIPRDTLPVKLRMIATSSTGCKDSVTKHLSPMQALADFGISDTVAVCGPVTVSLKAVPKKAVRYRWDFGDASLPFYTDSPTTYHLYDIAKGKSKFNIWMRAYDKFGCHYDVVKPNMLRIIGPVPNFSLSDTSGCDPHTVLFRDSSTGFNKQLFYNDDGGSNLNKLPPHTYRMRNASDTISVYSPYMLVFDTLINCAKAFRPEDSIWVYKSPKAHYGIMDTSACLTSTIRFRDSSTMAVKWFWDFENDGIVDDTTRNPVHHYTKDGLYDVKLKVRSRNGCEDSLIKPGYIVIPDRPLPGFFMSDSVLCYRQPVQFTDTTKSSRKLISWKWDFGDGAGKVSYAQHPQHVYANPGSYAVKLVVKDISGCTDSLTKPAALRMLDTIAADSTYLHYVSVAGGGIYITWRKSASPRFKHYRLYKWLPPLKQLLFESTDAGDTSYFDFNVSVNTAPFRYWVEMATQCQQVHTVTRLHNSMCLKTIPAGPTSIYLKWDAYHGWDTVIHYVLQRWNEEYKEFVPLATLQDTLYIHRHLCDSDYTYRVLAVNDSGGFVSQSNTSTTHPPFVYPNKPVEVLASTVIDDQNTITRWDTSNVFDDTRMYVLHRLHTQNSVWEKRDSLMGNTLTDSDADAANQSRSYYVTRRDYCGNISPPGNLGKTIWLQADNQNDTTRLTWTPYREWPKGIGRYLLEWLNTETGAWERVAYPKATDTAYVDGVMHNLTAPAFCYRITAIEKGQNPDSSRSNVACVTLPAMVYIPSAFTPNADGLNEGYRPVISFVYGTDAPVGLQYRFAVYNRWGELVYETANPQTGWDGSINGKAMPADVYVYVVEATSYKDKLKINRSGVFNLLR